MTTGPITLTAGWISWHTPPGAGVNGRDAAVLDAAQDLLLRDLHQRGSRRRAGLQGVVAAVQYGVAVIGRSIEIVRKTSYYWL